MRSHCFDRGTKRQVQQEDSWVLARCQRQEGNGNHVCEAASCSEVGGKQDRVHRGKQQRVERLKEETGQIPAKPQTPRVWTNLHGGLTWGCNSLRWLSPSAARCSPSVNVGNLAEKKSQIPLM